MDGLDSLPTFDLISNDGQVFTVDKEIASVSKLVKSCLELDSTSSQLNLSVHSDVLTHIIDYITYRHTHPLSQELLRNTEIVLKDDLTKRIDQWDADFIRKYTIDTFEKELVPLMLAVHYLDIPHLLTLLCAHVANLIRFEKLDTIRQFMGVEDRDKALDMSNVNMVEGENE